MKSSDVRDWHGTTEREFSNTVELYDFIPKYHWGKVQRINDKFLDSLEREFECRGVKYKVKIRPVSIEDRNGVERYYYPSKREELVEDALRKFVAEGQGVFLDEQAGVTFARSGSLITRRLSYKNVIARQLHRRISHHYVQASVANPYHILLSTIIRDFNLTQYAQLHDNLRDVQIALDEMIDKRAKLLDAKFVLLPDPSFTSEIIGSNKLQANSSRWSLKLEFCV